MKKLPKSVVILGQKFRVELVADLKDGTEELYGETDGAARTIKVCATRNKTDQEKESTLLHELIHAVLYVSGQSELLDSKTEEGLVIALENGIGALYQRR